MKNKLFVVVLIICCTSNIAFTQQIVKVGGYNFPPFIESSLKTKASSGVTISLIEALNDFQNKYKFEFVLTSPKRRYISFKNKRYDLIFFESITWGWSKQLVEASNILYHGDGDVYVALRKPGRDQGFFADFKNKKMIGVLGYHYNFANLKTNHAYLEKNFQIELTPNPKSCLRVLLTGRGDIALVTKSYLQNQLLKNPKLKEKILISKKYDQRYKHTILVRKNFSPGIKEINQMLNEMKEMGLLQEVLLRHGIVPEDL